MGTNARDGLWRLQRWSRAAPPLARELSSLVVSQVLPVFLDAGFTVPDNYGRKQTMNVKANCLPLQRQHGHRWPTIEIEFMAEKSLGARLLFSELPERCFQLYPVARFISRSDAVMADAAKYLMYGNAKGPASCEFSCSFWQRLVGDCPQRIVSDLVFAVPDLIDAFADGRVSKWMENITELRIDNVCNPLLRRPVWQWSEDEIELYR